MDADAEKILQHDADNEFLCSLKIAPLGRYDNEPGVREHLDRAAALRREIAAFNEFKRS